MGQLSLNEKALLQRLSAITARDIPTGAEQSGRCSPRGGDVSTVLVDLAQRICDLEAGSALDHGTLTGLGDDDHPQYLTPAEHDTLAADNPHSVTFTQTVAADAGTDISVAEAERLTDGSDASTATELHHHDSTYFTEAEHLDSSAGAGDSGKPVKLDAAGHIDATMINDADIDHGTIGGLGDDDHAQYLTEVRHDALAADNPHSVTFTQAVAADGGTGITAAEAETLTDDSNADALHTHALLTSTNADTTLTLTDTAGVLQTLTGSVGILSIVPATTLLVTKASSFTALLTATSGVTISAGNLEVSSGTALFDDTVTCEAEIITEPTSPAQITSNQDNYAGANGFSVARLNTDASRNITGFTGGVTGMHLWIINVGSFNIVLQDEVTSTAANQIITGTGEDLVLLPNDTTHLFYDGTSSRWRCLD